MTARDLQIGNYILLKQAKDENGGIIPERIAKVKMISESGIVLEDAEGYTISVDNDCVLPILLTDEILEKNGFTLNKEETNGDIQEVYKHYTKFFNFPLGSGFYIEHDTVDNIFWISDHWHMRFKYVHEFQQVLRLCRIEKEIEL